MRNSTVIRFCVVGFVAITLCGCVDSSKQTEAPVTKAPAGSGSNKLVNARQPGPKDADAPTDFITTSTGLKYRVLRKTGGSKPRKSDHVLANYEGKFDDGVVFDSSYKSGKSLPVDMRGGVIDGWLEGLQYCPEGGMIELEVPPDLAYGANPNNGMPPNATLHFIIEVAAIQ